MVAYFADRVQLLDLLTLGHQVENVVEGLAERSASKNRHDYDFAAQSSVFSKGNDVFEELSLVNSNYIEIAPDFFEFAKLINGHGLLFF